MAHQLPTGAKPNVWCEEIGCFNTHSRSRSKLHEQLMLTKYLLKTLGHGEFLLA